MNCHEICRKKRTNIRNLNFIDFINLCICVIIALLFNLFSLVSMTLPDQSNLCRRESQPWCNHQQSHHNHQLSQFFESKNSKNKFCFSTKPLFPPIPDYLFNNSPHSPYPCFRCSLVLRVQISEHIQSTCPTEEKYLVAGTGLIK